uniref:Uncharacterized protein n=1 Tax=Oryza brachyantha TaxID=4533 RepID=J3MYQ3_ORYBR
LLPSTAPHLSTLPIASPWPLQSIAQGVVATIDWCSKAPPPLSMPTAPSCRHDLRSGQGVAARNSSHHRRRSLLQGIAAGDRHLLLPIQHLGSQSMGVVKE